MEGPFDDFMDFFEKHPCRCVNARTGSSDKLEDSRTTRRMGLEILSSNGMDMMHPNKEHDTSTATEAALLVLGFVDESNGACRLAVADGVRQNA